MYSTMPIYILCIQYAYIAIVVDLYFQSTGKRVSVRVFSVSSIYCTILMNDFITVDNVV